MREAPVTLADAVHQRRRENWDVLFTTDMLNLAEFRVLCPRASCLPSVVYFHENQLTYPQSENIDAAAKQRDMHFAFSNFVTALAAEQVWFNSEFHRQEFLAALPGWLTRMPDGDLQTRILSLADKPCVMYPL